MSRPNPTSARDRGEAELRERARGGPRGATRRRGEEPREAEEGQRDAERRREDRVLERVAPAPLDAEDGRGPQVVDDEHRARHEPRQHGHERAREARGTGPDLVRLGRFVRHEPLSDTEQGATVKCFGRTCYGWPPMVTPRATRLPSKTDVLEIFGEESRPLHAREIASRLKVSEADYLGLQRLLDDLSFEGVLAARPGQRFQPLAEDGERRAAPSARGCSRCTRAASASWPASTRRATTCSSRPSRSAARCTATRCACGSRARSARGAEGEVVAVVERGIKRVAGTLRRKGKSAWLEPDDTRIRGPIVLPRAIDADGPEGNSGNDGDAVVVAHHALARVARREPGGRASRRCSGGRASSRRGGEDPRPRGDRGGRTPSEAVAEAEAFGDEVPDAHERGPRGPAPPPAADHRPGGRARSRRRGLGRAHAEAAATARGSRSPT